jgi:hypothetical protein
MGSGRLGGLDCVEQRPRGGYLRLNGVAADDQFVVESLAAIEHVDVIVKWTCSVYPNEGAAAKIYDLPGTRVEFER